MEQITLFDLDTFTQEVSKEQAAPVEKPAYTQLGFDMSIQVPTVRRLLQFRDGSQAEGYLYGDPEMAQHLGVTVEQLHQLLFTGVIGFTAKEGTETEPLYLYTQDIFNANAVRLSVTMQEGYQIYVKRNRKKKDPIPWGVYCQGDIRSWHATATLAREEATARVYQFEKILGWAVTQRGKTDNWIITPGSTWRGVMMN